MQEKWKIGQELPANTGDVRDAGSKRERDTGSMPGSGRSPGRGHGYPLQYSCLENPMNKGAWKATVYRVAKSWTRLKLLSMQGKKENARNQSVLENRGLGTEQLVPENWVYLLVFVKPIDTTMPNIGRRKYLLLLTS